LENYVEMVKVNLVLVLTVLGAVIYSGGLHSQVILDADGEGETYELINSVLAPNGDVVEVPDCAHPDFGRHIDEVYDSILEAFVFRLHMHVTPDNDRCINFDRQRNEIKTYDQSPDSLLGVIGEAFEYKWKFKIDSNFQSSSSFTHLHQLKAVGGPEDGMPLITLTTRKGSPDNLELRYAAATSQSTIKKVGLYPFKGTWLEATELVNYGEQGTYSIKIVKIDTEEVLFDYSNSSIRMWKTDTRFIRPKWGIYRSLNNTGSLRDEMLYFANFGIKETAAVIVEDTISPTVALSTLAPEPIIDSFDITIAFSEPVNGFGENDLTVTNGAVVLGSLTTSDGSIFMATIVPAATGNVILSVNEGVAVDEAGNNNEAADELIVAAVLASNIDGFSFDDYKIYPNPVVGILNVVTHDTIQTTKMTLFDQVGRTVFYNTFTTNEFSLAMNDYKKGIYIVRLQLLQKLSYSKIVIE
jgi:hypothetical protein